MNTRTRERWMAYNDAVRRMNTICDEIQKLPEDASKETVDEASRRFDDSKTEVERCKANAERDELITEARANGPSLNFPDVRGSLNAESVYRPDTKTSFFRDIVNSRQDPTAMERL